MPERMEAMLKDSLTKALSDQTNAEFYSAYLYLSMSAFAEKAGYDGFANWFYVQAREEMAHGIHIYQHILERGASPAFAEVKAPDKVFSAIKDAFETTVTHERHVTELINNIAAIAMGESDFATYNFISWFVNEQVEEESQAEKLLSKVIMIGDDKNLLLNLDAELALRVFNDPFAANAAT